MVDHVTESENYKMASVWRHEWLIIMKCKPTIFLMIVINHGNFHVNWIKKTYEKCPLKIRKKERRINKLELNLSLKDKLGDTPSEERHWRKIPDHGLWCQYHLHHWIKYLKVLKVWISDIICIVKMTSYDLVLIIRNYCLVIVYLHTEFGRIWTIGYWDIK